MQRIVFNLITAAGFLLWPLGAGAGWIESGESGTVLHIRIHDWIFPDPARTDTATRAEAAAVREFTQRFPVIFKERYAALYKAHPDIYGEYDWDRVSIQVHNFSGIKVEGVESDLLAIAGKVAPDVIYVNFRKSDTYIQEGFLYPLDNQKDGYLSSMSRDDLEFRVHPKIWPVIRRKGPEGNTAVWAIPYGGALGRVTLYRKDLFDLAGVSYPSADWTWDDMLNACRKLADPGRGVYALQFSRGKHESWYWVSYLWSMGGEVMTYDAGLDRWEIAFDSDAAVEALDFYTRLNTEPWTDSTGRRRYGYAYKDASDSYFKWMRGEIAMATGYIDEKVFATINPDVTGMAPLPIGPTGIRAGELNSRMMGLYSEIPQRAIRDAAWEFIRFYESQDAVEIKTRVMVEGGLGRFVNPRYLRLFGYEELVRLAPPGWEDTFKIAIATGKPEPYGRHSNIAYDLMTEPLQEAQTMALSGKLPTEASERMAVLKSLLVRAADKARHKMLGEVPADLLAKQRLTAGMFLVAVIVVFSFVYRKIADAFRPPAAQTSPLARGWQFRRYAPAYLLLLPALITILVWQYIPLLRGSVMAFQDYRLVGDSSWVWLDNFGAVLWDRDWWASVWNAVRYSTLVVALTLLPPILLAILLQEIPRANIFFRTVYYLPAVITGLVVILLWKSFYEPTEAGALNRVILEIPAWGFLAIGVLMLSLVYALASRLLFHGKRLWGWVCLGAGLVLFSACLALAMPALIQPGVSGLERLTAVLPEPYRWLSDPSTAMLACVVPMVWAGVGPGCLIYLAALKGIADEYYEAADIDGATFVDKILFVVFPILKPLIMINFIGVFIGSWFGATANILAMTGGAADTEVAGLRIFYEAFMFLKFGPATAMAWVLGFILIGFTVYQLRILSRLEFRTTGNDDAQGA